MLQPNHTPAYRYPTPESMEDIIKIQDYVYGLRSYEGAVEDMNRPRLTVIPAGNNGRDPWYRPKPEEFDEEIALRVQGIRLYPASRRREKRDGLNIILDPLPERAYLKQSFGRAADRPPRELLLISHLAPNELSVSALTKLVKNSLPDHLYFQPAQQSSV